MVEKFESGTRDLGSHYSRSMSNEDAATASQRRPKLMLTRPKEPEFQTTHRVRAVRMKSSSELEEEMRAKIPKFRAWPFNKKIAEAPSFPPLPRTAPQLPDFNEFQLKTMERASRHADTCSEASSVGTMRILERKGGIGVFAHPKAQATEPKEFHFRTDDLLGPPAVADLLDKLSLYSESSSYNDKRDMPGLTIPKPFNLHTDIWKI
ncbi:protein TPX2-like [Triticum aestivum]|uniref:protein TPX2-like n=1 Tax=Triticum aestivum TaxID=4565 RepID=UPI001D00FAC4|nr:protein TPX2-like [Triticum aestivum]